MQARYEIRHRKRSRSSNRDKRDVFSRIEFFMGNLPFFVISRSDLLFLVTACVICHSLAMNARDSGLKCRRWQLLPEGSHRDRISVMQGTVEPFQKLIMAVYDSHDSQ
jgi:hypothetical protein